MTDKLKIAILDDYLRVALKFADWRSLDADITVFHDTISGPSLIDRLRPFDIVCLMRERTPFPADLINALPLLKLIVTTGPRNLSIDVAAAQARGIVVCGTESRAPATAQHAMSLILAGTRGLVADAISMRDNGWQRMAGRDLSGLTLGLIGLGRLGEAVSKLARPFGVNLIAWSENLTDARCAEVGVRRVASLNALLSEADVASVHLVLSDRTRGLIGADALRSARPDGVLVNTSRGPIVDSEAVLDALRAGRLGAAALDVFDEEPLPPSHPLRDQTLIDEGKLLLTPHVGYGSRQTYELFYRQTVEDIAAWRSGAPIRQLKA